MKKIIFLILSINILCLNVSTLYADSEDIYDYNGIIEEPFQIPYENLVTDDVEVHIFPSSYNVDANKEYVTSVKNQSALGTCWAFATLSTLESSALKLGLYSASDNIDLSENYLRFISSIYGESATENSANKYGYDRKPGDGGNFIKSLACLTRNSVGGVANESDDPYTLNLFRNFEITKNTPITNIDIRRTIKLPDIPTSEYNESAKINRIEQIKELIMEYGSVNLYFNSNSNYFNGNKTAYYCDSVLNYTHAVSIVGWDDNYSKTNFREDLQPSNNGAFVVKNSWGQNWGNSGYFYMSYDCADGFRGIQTFADLGFKDSYDKLYEYDELGCNNSIKFGKEELYYANKFKLTDGTERLKAISTYFNSENNYFKVYVSTTGKFEDLKEVNILNAGPKYQTGYYLFNAGYVVLDLNEPEILDNDEFIVCVGVFKKDSNLYLPTETKDSTPYIECEQGQSYYSNSLETMKNGNAIDTYSNVAYGNVCIKAFTDSYQHKWDFSDERFDRYSTENHSSTPLYTDRTVDGLTLNASASKTMEIDLHSKTVNGVTYKRRLKLEGEGNLNERSVSFDVFGNANIYIVANANEERNLKVANKDGEVLETIKVGTEPKVYCYEYSGNEDEIYLYSEDSGIYIYAIGMEEKAENQAEMHKDWSFADSAFDGHTSFAEKEVIDELAIMPNSTIGTSNLTVDNKAYTKYLGFSGAGALNEKSVAFDVSGDCNITIVGKSTGSDTRNIVVTDEKGYFGEVVPATSEGNIYTIKYRGNATTLNIRSQSGGVRIYKISAHSVESEPRVERANISEVVLSSLGEFERTITDEVATDSAIRVYNTITAVNEVAETSEYLYYDQLSEVEKGIYNKIYNKLITEGRCDGNILITYENADINANELEMRKAVKTAISAFMNDYPKAFMIESFDYDFCKSNESVKSIDIYITKQKGCGNDEQTGIYKTQLDTAVNNMIEGLSDYEIRFNSDYDKINAFAEMLNGIDNSGENKNNALGALVLEKADSFGIARGFKALCDESDIPCIYAEGYCSGENKGYNIVNAEGNWYICDIMADKIMTKLENNYTLENPSIYADENVDELSYPNVDSSDYVVLGDVDYDGIITATDAAIVLQYARNYSLTETTRNRLRADVDLDGAITATDAGKILEKAKNSESTSFSMRRIKNDVDLEEFAEIYNALSEQFGTDKLTAEEISELLNI